MTIVAFLIGVAAGLAFGVVFFRSERAYRQGWQHGYRQAWLKRNKALLSAQTQDWKDIDDE